MNRVHVGIDATTWSNDRGFGRFTREFVTALAARDSEFRYTLVFDTPPDPRWPVADGIETIIAGTDQTLNEASRDEGSRSPGYLWHMGRVVRRAAFDMFFFPAVYSYFPLLSRVPKVICYHDTTAERLPHLLFPTKRNHRLWQLKTWLAKQQTTRAMTVSEASARDMEHFLRIPRSRIDVVTEAAEPVFRPVERARGLAARERLGIPGDRKLFVYVGGMNAHKNILGLLKAMPQVIADHPDAHLAIVGSISGKGFWDNVPELMAFVDQTPGLAAHVTFPGYVPDENLVELFAATDALVFPSLWEGFGLPAVEAMSCGVPVLSSDRGSLPEVVGDAGLYFDPENKGEIVACLRQFLEDPALRERLRLSALPRAEEFTWARAAELGEESFRRALR